METLSAAMAELQEKKKSFNTLSLWDPERDTKLKEIEELQSKIKKLEPTD